MIRPATASDISALARVHVASWQAAYRHILPEEVLEQLSVPQFETNWTRNLCDTQRQNLVLEVEGSLGGFLSWGNSRDADARPDLAEVYSLYLLPELWGQGYARVLWEEGLGHLLPRFSGFTLWVLQDNARARRFYEARGLEREGHFKTISLYGVDLVEVRYQKVF